MADTTISGLAAASTVEAADLTVLVDVHDTTMGPTGTDKKLTLAQLFGALTGDVTFEGLAGAIAAGAVTSSKLADGAVALDNLAAGTANTLLGFDGEGNPSSIAAGANVTISGGTISATGGSGGSGTVTSVSVVSANGLAGTVATDTTTPAITLSTTVSGVLKGSGGALTEATAGTDYVTPSGSITGTSSNVTGTVAVANGGTGETTAAAGFNALSPLTTLGDVLYEGSSGAARLAGNTSGTKKFLAQTGTGSASAAPSWATISTSDIPDLGVAQGGTGQTSLTAHAVLLGEGTSAVGYATVGTAGRVLIDQGSGTDPAFEAISGDATLAATGSITVTKTNGTAFAASATTDATNASNITSGTLPNARLSAIPTSALATGTANTLAGYGSGGAFGGVAVGSGLSLSGGTLTATGGGGGGSPGGSSGQLQYNASGSFGGAANLTVGSSGQLNFAAQSAPGSPNVGDEWFDSTQKCRTSYGGLIGYHSRLIYAQTAAVDLTGTGAQSLLNTSGAVGAANLPLPTGVLNVVGRSLWVRASGYWQTSTASGYAAFFQVLLGGSCVATSVSSGWPASSTGGWMMDLMLTIKSTGATGSIDTSGYVHLGFSAASYVRPILNGTTAGTQTPGTSPIANLTGSLALDLQLNTNDAFVHFVPQNLTIEALG